jgi:hypothetical protein
MSASSRRRAGCVRIAVKRRPVGERFSWPPDLLGLLGKLSDPEIARRAGVEPGTVAAARKRRGILAWQPHRRPVEWTPEMIAQLGTDSDGNVARMLGLPRACVKRQRKLRRIPPYLPPPHDCVNAYPWTPEEIARLGNSPDKKVALQLGISAAQVSLKRRALGIRPFGRTPPVVQWSAPMLALLGRIPDTQLARRFGIAAITVKRKRQELGLASPADRGIVVPTRPLRRLLRRSLGEIHRRSGLCGKTARRLRRALGVAGPAHSKLGASVM